VFQCKWSIISNLDGYVVLPGDAHAIILCSIGLGLESR